jgi:hypothetical protein
MTRTLDRRRPMAPAELVAAAEAMFGDTCKIPRPVRSGWGPRPLRSWRDGNVRVPDASEQTRALARIWRGLSSSGPIREIIREAGARAAQSVSQAAVKYLKHAGPLDKDA